MKTTFHVLVGSAVLIGMATIILGKDPPAAKPHPKPAATQQKPLAAGPTNHFRSSALPIIGYLESRGQTIVIKAGTNGPVYSVKTPDGKPRFEDLSLEQLRAQAPEVHQFIKSAVAANPGSRAGTADASLRFPHQR